MLAGPDDETATVVAAAFENPMLRNLPVDLRRYPEIQHALDTGEVVLARDVRPIRSSRRCARTGRWRDDVVTTRSAHRDSHFASGSEPAGVFYLRTSAATRCSTSTTSNSPPR